MTREQKVAKAKQLKGQGLTNREIAERFGYSTSAVTKMLNPNAVLWRQRSETKPERKAAKREWDRQHRPPCPECGAPMWRAGDRCRDCHDTAEKTRIDQRAAKIAEWWVEGLSLREIGDRLGGWTANHVNVEIQRLRAKGYDIPHRYRVRNRKRVAA